MPTQTLAFTPSSGNISQDWVLSAGPIPDGNWLSASISIQFPNGQPGDTGNYNFFGNPGEIPMDTRPVLTFPFQAPSQGDTVSGSLTFSNVTYAPGHTHDGAFADALITVSTDPPHQPPPGPGPKCPS